MAGVADVGDGSTELAAVPADFVDVTLIGRRSAELARRVRDAVPHAPARPRARTRWLMVMALLSLAVDVVAVELAYILAKAFRATHFDIGPVLLHEVDTRIFLTSLAWPMVFALYGLYDLQRPTHMTAEMQRLLQAVVTSVLLVVLIAFATQIELSRGFILSLLGFGLVTTVGGRLALRRLAHDLNARAVTSQLTLVVGCNDEARTMARTFRRRPWMGYAVSGFAEVSPTGLDHIDGIPVLGGIESVGSIVRERGISTIVIAGSAAGGETLQQIDSALDGADVTVRVSPGLPNLGASRVVLEPVDGMALFSLRRQRFSRRQRLLKRALDVVAASILLTITLPFIVVAAVLVRVTSSGPVLFRQRRVGAHGHLFTLYKFRTMVQDAEEQRSILQADNEADGLLFKMRDDPRVTRVGRVLRRFSLDELPQLWNVLRGEMSMVGPRPALPEEVERYDEQRRARLRVKPGLTGLWQVNGRHDLVFEDYVRYDLFYVANWSLTMDLYILAKTIPAVLGARGSY